MNVASQVLTLLLFPTRLFLIGAALWDGTYVPSAAAQNSNPTISPGGVVNAASFMPADGPAGAIARGSIFSIFGTNLGPAEGIANQQLPLAKEFGGVTVAVFETGGNRFDAYPLFVSAGQINALMPSEVPAGQYFVRVEFAGGQSNGIPVKVVHSSFGIFGRPLTSNTDPPFPTGPRVAVAQNHVDGNTLNLNRPETAARPAQAVVLWGTGLGPIPAPDAEPPPVGDVDTAVEVLIGGKPAEILYQGRSPCCPGVDQINLIIPDDVPMGCAVPISVRVHGAIYSNIETISIGRDGRGCSDAVVIPGGRRGRISLYHTLSMGETVDSAQALFLGRGERTVYPPPSGNCIAFGVKGLVVSGLDAGTEVQLQGPQISVPLTGGPSFFSALAPPGPLFLGPGQYTAFATGGTGADAVGPFEAEILVGADVEWAEPAGSTAASRNGIPLTWSKPLDDRIVSVSLLTVGDASRAGFQCSVADGAESFEVPPEILANVPVRELAVQLAQHWDPAGSEFSAAGLDGGEFDYWHTEARTVILPPVELPSTPIKLPNGRLIQAELAATFEERANGLMHRPELAENRGMLFLFDSPGIHPFWMYRTLVPLDIIWLDADRKIVFISANTPPCESENSPQCPNYFPTSIAKFVLEIPARQAAANGLDLGSQLDW